MSVESKFILGNIIIILVVLAAGFRSGYIAENNKNRLYKGLQHIDKYNIITCKSYRRHITTTVKDIIGYKYGKLYNNNKEDGVITIRRQNTITVNGMKVPNKVITNFDFSDCKLIK